MKYLPMLKQAADSAARAAGAARLPGAVRDLAGAIGHADNATSLTQKATSLLSSAAPLVSGPHAQLVRRSAGIIELASKDLSAAGSQSLQEAGQRLGNAGGVLQRVMGGAVGGVAKDLLAQQARSMLSASSLSLSDALPAGKFLLEMVSDTGKIFRFSLGRAAYDRFHRNNKYNTPTQDRLTRCPAAQAVGKGSETISVSGVIFLATHGAGHLDELRAMGGSLSPVRLTTGYGASLGRWYISSVDEEQDFLFVDGAPRKQTFTLELIRYGDDYQNT